MPKRKATDIDIHVGGRLRLRRTVLELSQVEVGDKIGVSFQQIQKYERGTNRISAGHLFMLAEKLGVQVAYFYEGLVCSNDAVSTPIEDTVFAFFATPDGIALARDFIALRDVDQRRAIRELVQSMTAA